MEITADIFNLLNLINSDWGLNRSTQSFERTERPDERGRLGRDQQPAAYSVPSSLPARDRVSVGSSRWRMQLGLKYVW